MNQTSSTRSSLAMEMGELYTSECSSPLYLEFNWTHHALISSRAIPFHYCWMKPLWIRCNWSKRTCTVSCLVMFLLYIPHSLNSPVSTHPAQRLWQTAGAGMIIYFIKWRLPNTGNIDFFFFGAEEWNWFSLTPVKPFSITRMIYCYQADNMTGHLFTAICYQQKYFEIEYLN